MARLARIPMGQYRRLCGAYPVLSDPRAHYLDATSVSVFVAIDEYVFNDLCDQNQLPTTSDVAVVLQAECSRLREIAERRTALATAKRGVRK